MEIRDIIDSNVDSLTTLVSGMIKPGKLMAIMGAR